jgi:hypothetical protein
MTAAQRKERKAEFGDHPPDRSDSIVARLWKSIYAPLGGREQTMEIPT